MIAYTKNETILKLDHVNLSFGDRVILRDVNADVKDIVRTDCVQGQVIAFLGPSGIGKTQLSRIIAGLQKPTSGAVLLGEQGIPTAKGLVGMVPQNYPLFDFENVLRNLLIAGRQAGLSDDRATTKAVEYLDVFDLKQYAGYYPAQLSGGTKQRVAIIRQLMCSEHFLVMDEPFSGLDLINKQRACELITKVASLDELNTIIVVTHDVTEGLSVADEVWLMGREPGLPGARLVETYDMAAAGLCWNTEIQNNKEFVEFVGEVKERFKTLV